MGIRRRTRRVRRWYRRKQYSSGIRALRILVVVAAASGVAILVALALQMI